MERTQEINIRLTESHAAWLRDAADNSRMDLGEYFQRLLQNHVDESFELPHPVCRTLSELATKIIGSSNHLSGATRALEQGDARNRPLQAEIADAVMEFRDVIREIRGTLDAVQNPG